MKVFIFDHTLEGLLTAVFEAYNRRTFPDLLLPDGVPLPLFYEETLDITTDEEKATRVWTGLSRKLSAFALQCVARCWLAEEEETPLVMFRFICKVFDSPVRIETNQADPDVHAFTQMWRRVEGERTRLMQFIRFQKAADGTYFAAIGRTYGFYYNGHDEVQRVTIDNAGNLPHLTSGRLDESLMAPDEALFQSLWKTYFQSICIRERINPRKQRQDMPVRYWKYLTEKQN